jgi:triosephosphate isomerase
MRVPIIAANWKMYKRVGEALRFVEDLSPRVQDLEGVEVVIAAPFTALEPLKGAVAATPIQLAGQNVYPEPQGAFTGEISVSMLADVGCRYVIVGHSERRHIFGETNELIARKERAVLDGGLRLILCIGETLDEREAGNTFDVLRQQIASPRPTWPRTHTGSFGSASQRALAPWPIGSGSSTGAR